MRLDTLQRTALNKAVKNVGKDVWLFGSRVDNNKRGGDIDILIFSDKNPYKLSQEVSINFFKECEEKIDVVVMNPNNLTPEQKAFLNVINKVKLK